MTTHRTTAAAPSAAAQGRKFGYTVGLAFLVLAAVSLLRHHELPPRILGALGTLLIMAATVAPARLGPVERAWMGLAHAMSKVTTPIFMGVLYFLLFTPVGAVRRALGKNALVQARGASSFWADRPAGKRRGDLQRQF